ncbi:hypothetical protein JCM15519_34180 [Fundidesulfovibrio butyratiphilus]
MGRYLQIRVSAVTVDLVGAERAWPQLVELAWPHAHDYAKAPRGVLELVDALEERLRYGQDVSPAARKAYLPDAQKILTLKEQLEEALSRWDASTANRLSDTLEDALDALEGRIRAL